MPLVMVFGWKKKQHKEEPVAAPIHRSIVLKDIGPVLEKLTEQRRAALVAEYRSSLPEVRQKIAEILKIGHALERETLTADETDKHISTIVERGKNQVISIIKKVAGDSISDVSSYGDIADVNREMHRILKMIGDVLGRQTRVIHIFAKKYATQIKRILAELNDTRDELTRSLQTHISFEGAVTRLRDQIRHLESLYATVESSKKRISDIEQEQKAQHDLCESSKKKITAITGSAEYAAYKEILVSIDELDILKSRLGHRIDESFTKISRPLSKYIYVSSLDKAIKATMKAMLDSPANALFTSDSAQIVTVLEHVRKAISSRLISVKDITKSQEQIDAIMPEIDGYYLQISEHAKKRAALDSSLREFDSSALASENATLKGAQEKIESLKMRESEIHTDHDAAKASIPQVLKSIETQMRAITNITYTVNEDV